jgi:glycerol-3-phosphate acyltransferase PlsY
VLGKKGFYFTFVADILKGAVMVWLSKWLGFSPGVVAAVVVVVIAGHIWPIWHHFHGGKGIATGLGAVIALDYTVLLIGGVVLLVTYMMFRRFLPSWIVTVAAMPLIAYILGYPLAVVVPLILAAAIVVFAHKENIRQQGFLSENKG